MATDDKMYNDRGLDSSGDTNPQSPLERAGTAQDWTQFTKGTVQTDFDPMSLDGSVRSDD